MTPLDAYEHIIDPKNFIKNFATDESFKDWLRQGLINDCRATLKVFEKADMFEQCVLIQSVIDEKIDRMLGGLGIEID